VPAVIVVTPSSPIGTFAEFIKAGIDTPGSLSIADSGVGTTHHVLIELMSAAAGAKYTLVHYKGSGQATIDVVAGQVPAMVDQSTVRSAISRPASCSRSR
jgi:tripartite-type tricarboxylate transporter receptor subunit TctC